MNDNVDNNDQNDNNNNNGISKKQQYFELDDNFGSSTGVFVNKNGPNDGNNNNNDPNTNPDDDFNLGNDLIKTEINNSNPDASPSQQPFGLRGLSLPIMHLQQISEQTPIQDFHSMLQQGADDINAINRAFDLFVKLIKNFAFTGGGGHRMNSALQCLNMLRQACVQYQNPQVYNDLIVEITDKCKEVDEKSIKKLNKHILQLQQQQMGMMYGGYGGCIQQQQQ
eukprot:UN01978